MDSFGFDFSSSDFSLDLGSLGMWGGNSTPLGSSPNGGNLPFSVGTPTGVQSLGDEPFGSLPGGNDDFNFTDSPKTGGNSSNAGNNAGPAASGPPPAATGRKPGDELANPYFGGDLDSDLSDNKSAATAGAAASVSNTKIKAESKDPAAAAAQQRKDSTAALSNATSTSTANSAPLATATTNSSSEQGGGLSSYLMTDAATTSGSNAPPTSTADPQPQRSPAGFPQQPKVSSSPGAPARNPATSSMPSGSSVPTSTASSAPPASTNASSARPHIDGSPAVPSPSGQRGGPAAHQQPQQQQQMPPGQQQRYPNQAMMGAGGQPMQPPHFAGQPPYQMNPQGNPMGMAAQPPTVNGQYMQHPQFRQATSSYDEEYMRVRAMMMQHPDLIPPPMEVLRISMSQSAPNQNMMAAGGYMPPQQRPGMMNRVGASPGYPPYGAPNPGMIMNPQAQSPMMDARMRAMQQQQQQMGGPPGRQMPQARTPNGGPVGGPESQAAWQSENDLPLRRKMIGKIVSLLQQRKPDAPAEWIRRLPDMARRLEDSLYRTAKNRDEYGDFSSLKTRLQHLAVTMGARAQHKVGKPRAPNAGIPGSTGMMPPGAQGMPMNQPQMPNGMPPQGHVVGNMPYGANAAGRMTQQQMLQQQQLHMQMQNPQMRQQFTPQQMQQFTPQQMQQFQAAQLQQRRQFQMQQAQQAQMQRQTSMQQQQQQHHQQQQQQQQQFQQSQALQRQNSMRQQQQMQPQAGGNGNYPMDPSKQQQQMQQMNQRNQNPSYMQQQQQAQAQAQNAQLQQQQQQQRRAPMNGTNATGRMSADMSLGQGLGSEANDFLNLDLSSSLLGSDDLQSDSSGAPDSNAMKGPSGDGLAGAKRTLSQSQQQLAAAANAAAFKRTKVGGVGPSRGPHSPSSSQNPMQKPAPGSGGSSKTPSMSTVNAK